MSNMSEKIDQENLATRSFLGALLIIATAYLGAINISSSKGKEEHHRVLLSGYENARKDLDKALKKIINNPKHLFRDELIAIAAFAVLGIESEADLIEKNQGDTMEYKGVRLDAAKLRDSKVNIPIVKLLQKMINDRYILDYRGEEFKFAYVLPKALVKLVKETYRVQG